MAGSFSLGLNNVEPYQPLPCLVRNPRLIEKSLKISTTVKAGGWGTQTIKLYGHFLLLSSDEETRKCESTGTAGGKRFTLTDANRQQR